MRDFSSAIILYRGLLKYCFDDWEVCQGSCSADRIRLHPHRWLQNNTVWIESYRVYIISKDVTDSTASASMAVRTLLPGCLHPTRPCRQGSHIQVMCNVSRYCALDYSGADLLASHKCIHKWFSAAKDTIVRAYTRFLRHGGSDEAPLFRRVGGG